MNDTTPINELNGVEIIACEDADRWSGWLAEHHGRHEGVWLKVAKKASGVPSITIPEALDVALCYGWIDGQRKGLDTTYYLQKYTPRRPRSEWSMVNVRKVEALIAASRMRAPGYAAIEAAKADGCWDAAYESQRNATIPPDLEAALAGNDRARMAFEALGKTDRYQVIVELLRARTPETRAARLTRAIEWLQGS